VYNIRVKKKDFEKILIKHKWYFLRHGANHDVWTNGEDIEPVPRHKEINEKLARSIIKRIKR